MVLLGGWLDSMILEVFSNLYDSMFFPALSSGMVPQNPSLASDRVFRPWKVF